MRCSAEIRTQISLTPRPPVHQSIISLRDCQRGPTTGPAFSGAQAQLPTLLWRPSKCGAPPSLQPRAPHPCHGTPVPGTDLVCFGSWPVNTLLGLSLPLSLEDMLCSQSLAHTDLVVGGRTWASQRQIAGLRGGGEVQMDCKLGKGATLPPLPHSSCKSFPVPMQREKHTYKKPQTASLLISQKI